MNPEKNEDRNDGNKKNNFKNEKSENLFDIIGKIKNIKGIKFLLLFLLSGIALIIIGSINFGKAGGEYDLSESLNTEYCFENINEYVDSVELELRMLIEKIGGVSDVRVMVTLDCLNEYVYAQNSTGGDSRSYATVSASGKSENMVLVKEVTPKIRGIGVVCKGGGNPEIQSEIIGLCCSMFNLPSNRVYVAAGGKI